MCVVSRETLGIDPTLVFAVFFCCCRFTEGMSGLEFNRGGRNDFDGIAVREIAVDVNFHHRCLLGRTAS